VKVREALGLSQRKAGELLGGGPRAFQKYESGKQAVSVPMSHLLRLLARDPSRLKELDATKGKPAPSRKSPQGRSSSGRAA
jgi:HTH-type transcriptional regulator/antitoxin MqsA